MKGVTVNFQVITTSGRGGKGNAQLKQLGKGFGKVSAELVLVVLVLHDILLESTIPE